MHVVSILDRHARRASALSRAVTNDFELKSRYKKVTARNVYAGDDSQQLPSQDLILLPATY
jgi:hypothetical protein